MNATEESGRPEGLGYETEDVRIGPTWAIIGGLAATVALVVAGLGLLMQHFAAAQRQELPPLTGRQTAPLTPPPPHVQPDPYRDLDALREAEAARLRGYAFTDDARRYARIPIERAMTLGVGKPLDP